MPFGTHVSLQPRHWIDMLFIAKRCGAFLLPQVWHLTRANFPLSFPTASLTSGSSASFSSSESSSCGSPSVSKSYSPSSLIDVAFITSQKNGLVAMLETLYTGNLCVRFERTVFFHQFFCFLFFFVFFVFLFVCICVREVSNKVFPPLSSRSLCPTVVIPLVCWLYMCACVYVSLYVHVKNV